MKTDRVEYKIGDGLWIYMSPCLMTFGLVGNILVFVVLSTSSMRRTTTSLYLRFLAVVDVMVLYTALLKTWIYYVFEYDIREQNSIVCKIHIWVSFWTDYTSTWLLVAVTLERCVSVWFPHKVKLIFTKHKTYIIIVSIMVFMALLSSHFLYGVGLNVKTTDNETVVEFCDFISQSYYNFHRYIWPWIDYCFYSVFPSFILVFCNIAIIYRVKVSSQHILRNESSNSNAIHNRSVASRKSQASSLTAMLLITSTAYVVLTTPVCVMVIYKNIFGSDLDDAMQSLVWAILSMMQYMNNCVNFVLYCVTGTRFRAELRNLCCRSKQRQQVVYIIRTNTRITNVDD